MYIYIYMYMSSKQSAPNPNKKAIWCCGSGNIIQCLGMHVFWFCMAFTWLHNFRKP